MNIVALAVIVVLAVAGLWQPPFGSLERYLAHKAVAGGLATASAPAPMTLPALTGEEPFTAGPDESLLAFDRASGTLLYAHNADRKRPLASITKLVTALVILDRHQPSDTVTVPDLPDYDVEAETIGLRPGERYRIDDLLAATLVPSANDAADALAIIDSGSTARFAERMNAKLAQWGIGDARFSNPSGLSDDGNYVTAASLAQVARLALAQPEIVRLTTLTDGRITSGTGRVTNYRTTNMLLYDDDFYGIKTGFTGAAGQCFAGLTRIDGHEVVTIVLGSNDRFGDTRSLRDWIERNWTWL